MRGFKTAVEGENIWRELISNWILQGNLRSKTKCFAIIKKRRRIQEYLAHRISIWNKYELVNRRVFKLEYCIKKANMIKERWLVQIMKFKEWTSCTKIGAQTWNLCSVNFLEKTLASSCKLCWRNLGGGWVYKSNLTDQSILVCQ